VVPLDAQGRCRTPPTRRHSSEPVNLGINSEISIHKLTELIARLTGFQGTIPWDESKPNGQPRCKLDFSRARDWFEFQASTPFNDGLHKTIAWYEQARR
jgi:dTDP-glucose 4,6-dehydratase/GDP-L-fucose synthase